MAGYSKYQYGIDILTLTIVEFVKVINDKERILEMLTI